MSKPLDIVFLMAGLPSKGNHGGALTCLGIIHEMRRRGHNVDVISMYDDSENNNYLSSIKANEQLLIDLDIGIHYVSYNGLEVKLPRVEEPQGKLNKLKFILKQMNHPRVAEHSIFCQFAVQVMHHIETIQPDIIFGYHFEPPAALHGQTLNMPTMMCVGDPVHLPGFFRWLEKPFSFSKAYFFSWLNNNVINKIKYKNLHKKLLEPIDELGAFAAHYARWFRQIGLDRTRYYRTPLGDPIGDDWLQKREAAQQQNHKPKIILVGDLRTTSTRSGIELFAKETLPVLQRQLGDDGFEAHLIGGGEPEPGIAPLLNHPSVILRGPVEPADDEFLSADILLVPTPITLGIRVRIIAGFAFGCCIVTHTANAAGIPELTHEENCLLGNNGKELGHGIVKAIQDKTLKQKLQTNARDTFTTQFIARQAAGEIVDRIEQRVSAKP